MLKFLYVGDMHGGSKPPKHRVDNYFLTREEKIKEILSIAKKNGVKAILQAGDFLDKPNVAPEFLTEEMLYWSASSLNDLLKEVMIGRKDVKELTKAIKSSIPMIGTVGNHELIGGELDSFEKTALSVLVKSGFMTLVNKEEPIIFYDKKEDFSVAITASPYTHDIDGEDKGAYIIEEKQGDYHIHMAHGMLMGKSYGRKFKHTTVQEIAYKTNADLTINGHDHIGYDEIELEGKKFINPGSPFRRTAEEKEIKRMPKVLLITIDKEQGVQLEPVYLKCAKAGTEVLSRDHINDAYDKREKIEEIKSLLNKANLKKGTDITEIIKNLGQTKGINEDVIKEVIDDIVIAINELETPFNPKGEYIIERLEIENFQSHKNSTFEFSKGINVLFGKSRNGKSAVLRAIRELFECYLKNPRNAIFYGEDHFKITAYLSNGYIISRIVEKKSSGKNGYEIFDPLTATTSYYNTKGLEIVQEILGFNKIKLTDKNKININFSIQGDSWFFLGNDLSSPDRAKMIGFMYGTQYADIVLKKVNATAKKITTDINSYQKEIDILKNEKEQYMYLDPLQKQVSRAEILYQEAEELEKCIKEAEEMLISMKEISNELNELKDLKNKLEENEKDYLLMLEEIKEEMKNQEHIHTCLMELKSIVRAGKQARYVANSLKDIENARERLDKIKKDKEVLEKEEEKFEEARRLIKNLIHLKQEFESLKTIAVQIEPISDYRTRIDELKELSENYEKAKKLYSDQISLACSIKKFEQIKDEMLDLDKARQLLKEIVALEEKQTMATDLFNQLCNIKEEISQKEKEKEKYTEQNKVYLEQYKKELEAMGECPVCHGRIDRIIINNLIRDLERSYQ